MFPSRHQFVQAETVNIRNDKRTRLWKSSLRDVCVFAPLLCTAVGSGGRPQDSEVFSAALK